MTGMLQRTHGPPIRCMDFKRQPARRQPARRIVRFADIRDRHGAPDLVEHCRHVSGAVPSCCSFPRRAHPIGSMRNNPPADSITPKAGDDMGLEQRNYLRSRARGTDLAKNGQKSEVLRNVYVARMRDYLRRCRALAPGLEECAHCRFAVECGRARLMPITETAAGPCSARSPLFRQVETSVGKP